MQILFIGEPHYEVASTDVSKPITLVVTAKQEELLIPSKSIANDAVIKP